LLYAVNGQQVVREIFEYLVIGVTRILEGFREGGRRQGSSAPRAAFVSKRLTTATRLQVF